MPIHEYDCEQCGHRFDFLLQRRDERVTCPRCGGERLERRLSVFAPRGAKGEPPPAPA